MHILITAGPTREYFDSVRFVSNGSTGRMGYAIADAAIARGHEVTLISGPVSLPAPNCHVIQVETADEMYRAAIEAFESCDAAIMTAAVSDYRPVKRHATKAPKPSGVHEIAFEPTPDICAELGRIKSTRIVVGFALQDDQGRERAAEKLEHKRCDAIVLNHLDTLGGSDARIEIKPADGPWRDPVVGTKARAAEHVIALVEELAIRD